MTFLSPAMLWSLVALVPLTAIYFLKVRPRRKPTTAYFLWERIFQEKRASSLFHRLRDAWSLALMALAASAVCFTLARPEWADQRKDLLIVIDNSASMAAHEGRYSRLDLAKRVASDIVQGLNGNQRAAVATVATRLDYHSHLTDNPRELLEAITAIHSNAESLDIGTLQNNTWEGRAATEQHTEGPAPSEPSSTKTVQAAAQSTPPPAIDHRVLLLSDGSFDTTKLPQHVELLKVGTSLENVGLVAADMEFLAGDTSHIGFYYQTASTFHEPKKVDLNLYSLDENGGEQLQKVIPLTIAPGKNRPETFQLTDAPAGRWLAKLEVDDALAEDNIAYLSLTKPKPIRVSVESADRFFLENSVHAFSQGESQLTLVKDKPDVVLAKSAAPTADFAIIFQPAGESIWWTKLGDEVTAGAARLLIEDHPALRHLDASSIPFVGARQIAPIAGAQVLVADDNGLPLIYKARHGRQTGVIVNLDPVAAEFYFSAWFPVLIHSAVTHLAGHENPLAAANRSGDPILIPGGREDVTTKVVAPGREDDPASEPVNVTGDVFRGAKQIGFYTLENPSGKYTVGESLLSSSETLLNNEASQSNNEPISRGQSPAGWLTVLAIVALTAESVLYHRRKVG
jgi:Ca-activated chloride channel family protein